MKLSRTKRIGSRAYILIAFLLGLSAGVGGSVIFYKKQNLNNNSNSSSNSSRLNESVRNRRISIDDLYEQAKSQINKDKDSGKLTEDQSKMLLTKLDEIYKYRKENQDDTDSQEARKKLSEKRSEWRKWLSDNNLPSRYTTRLST